MLVVINIDSLMRGALCGKLHRPPSQLFAQQQSSIDSQLFVQSRDLCLNLTPPLKGFSSDYCHNVCCGKTRTVWLPDGEKFWRKVYLFWQNSRTWQTDRRTDTAWRHRPRLHRIRRQKSTAIY